MRENRKLRSRAQAAEATVNALRAVVAEQSRLLAGLVLREQLAEPDDFWRYVAWAEVTGSAGQLDWALFQDRLADLLSRHPYLAAPVPPAHVVTPAARLVDDGSVRDRGSLAPTV